VFGDAVVATAIFDRLLHHSHIITIRGDSDRLREKRRSGLLKAPRGRRQRGGIGVTQGLPRWVHRDLPRLAALDSLGSLREARVPPVDYVDNPLGPQRQELLGNISERGNTRGQFSMARDSGEESHSRLAGT
jgi:hypothetical protein